MGKYYTMRKKYTIKDMQKLAESKGGKCLSTKYVNTNTKLKWQCKEGHIWDTKPFLIKMGHWCRECYRLSKFLTIEEMQEIAKSRGGKCLSTRYVDNRTKLKWQCKKGHIWEAVPDLIKRGAWCPRCSIKARGDKRRQTINELQEYARTKGGLCLSKEYPYSKAKLQWQCADGHTWWSDPTNIKQHWCPKCAQGLSERVCRKIFEAIFQEPFPSRKLSWLKGPRGGRMELDGYCKRLGVAFEYQGEQHYKRHDMFHKEASFEDRKQLDELKRRLCKEHNVILIEVPYTVDYEDMFGWIINECVKREVEIPNTDWIDHTNLDVYSPKRLKELQDLAAKRGGQCLSKAYLGVHVKMRWQCKEGHIWETMPQVIKRGNWCATCSGRHQWKIEDMCQLAGRKGGKCHSEKYIDNTTKLLWECKHGHQWESAPANILSGYWCPYCAKNIPLTLDDMHKLAKKRRGYCISKKYLGVYRKLKWKCKKGHVWEARPANVKTGTWCPYCIGRHRTIRDMQIIAKERGEECLSPKYLGSHKKHIWRCKEGHEWEADPNHVLHQNTWCPHCSGRIRERISIKCKQCGKEFLVRPYKAKTAKYCSNKCHNQSLREHVPWNKGKHYSVPSARKTRIKKTCQLCGKEFDRLACHLKRKGEGKYCSKKCHNASKIGQPPWNKGKRIRKKKS